MFSITSYATDYQSKYRFGNWAYKFLKDVYGWTPNANGWGACGVSEDSLHHASSYDDIDENGQLFNRSAVFVATCDYCGQEFHGLATEVEEIYNDLTPDYTIDSDGGVTDLAHWRFDAIYNTDCCDFEWLSETCAKVTLRIVGTHPPSGRFKYTFQVPANTDVYISGDFSYSATYDGTYTGCRPGTGFISSASDDDIEWNETTLENGNTVKWFNSGNETEFTLTSTLFSKAQNQTYFFNFPLVRYYVTEVDVTDTPVSGGGSLTYTDDNSNNQIIENQFFDQSTSTYYNPVTDESYHVEDWSYDYSTREFSGYTENGEVKIHYGDEQITVIEGGNTYNYFYGDPYANGSGSGGSGSGSDDDNSGSDTNIWEKLGHLLGTLLGGLIDLITGVIDGLLDGLISLVQTTLEKLGQIVNLFGSFGDSLRILWAWLPDEIITILTAGVSVVVFASVLKIFI